MINVRRSVRGGLTGLCAIAVVCLGAGPASAAAPLRLGFESDSALVGGTTHSRAPWISRAVENGARIVRLNVKWSQVAPRVRPRRFKATNPRSRAYHWRRLDGTIKDLTRHGLAVCLTIYSAPAWAEGRGRPANAEPGTWRPNAKLYAQFATAAALRYSGHFRAHRHKRLPRVRCWQAWNEPNITFSLSPQYVRRGQGWQAVGATIYRSLLNAFYHAVKRVSRSNFVLMGGTAPFGAGQSRTAPVTFYRDLFCLNGRRGCRSVHLDGVDHHPQAPHGPDWHAPKSNDVAVPDVYKIARVLRTGVAGGHVLPRAHKHIWVTELEWSSNPPVARAVPVLQDAQWYEDAFYQLWRQGVDTITLLELRDPGMFAGKPNVFESGLYYNNGKPKQVATAYRFPFVVRQTGPRTVRVWGRSSRRGLLKIETLVRGRWTVVRTLRVHRWRVFSVSMLSPGNVSWRAQVGPQTSLPFSPVGFRGQR